MKETRRVVVTGLGALTPVGLNVEKFWDGLLTGKSGAGPITQFDASKHRVNFACEVSDFDPADYFDAKDARRYERFVMFSLVAAKEALDDSGLDLEKEDRTRIATVMASGIGGLRIMEEQQGILADRGPDRVSPMLIPKLIPNMAGGIVSIIHNLLGPSTCPVTACASSTNAVGDAARMIAYGDAEMAVAGGTEAVVTAIGIAGFQNMKAISTRVDSPETASRPFSKDRDGFVLGEGAGVLILEEYEHAKARGAKIYAEVAGYGMSSDAHHMTAPAPEGAGAQRSMKAALKDAGMEPEELEVINAHGTSTPMNDKNETMAVKAVFGSRARQIPMSSIKSSIGHLLGAAGGVEAVASVMTIEKSVIPPTINYSEPDPECDLDYVTGGPREQKVRSVMTNSFGFGGHNATVIFRAID